MKTAIRPTSRQNGRQEKNEKKYH